MSTPTPKNKTHILDTAQQLTLLKELRATHPLWSTPLLEAVKAEKLSFSDLRFFFSQYYWYIANLPRAFEAVASNNEKTQSELETQHAHLLFCFLQENLALELTQMKIEDFTHQVIEEYWALFVQKHPIESIASLALGLCGITPTVCTIFTNNLRSVGLQEKEFSFLLTYGESHRYLAEKFEKKLLLVAQQDENWFCMCKTSLWKTLDLQQRFFENIYALLLNRNVKSLLKRVGYQAPPLKEPLLSYTIPPTVDLGKNVTSPSKATSPLSIHSMPFKTEVLDPRLCNILSGISTEYLQYPHETILVIMHGSGEVVINNSVISVEPQSVLYIPRWTPYKIHNNGSTILSMIAITDHGLTGRLPVSTASMDKSRHDISEKIH